MSPDVARLLDIIRALPSARSATCWRTNASPWTACAWTSANASARELGVREVKQATSVKDVNLHDTAVQRFVV
jgi:hypothetical protein